MNAKVNATKWTDRIARYRRSLMDPRAIILGVAILYLIATAVRVELWYQKYAQDPGTALPDYLLIVPFFLTVAALMLWSRRWWTESLAILVSGRVLFVSYLGFRFGFARDVPPFSLASFRIWLIQTYALRPQEFLEIALAVLIACYAIVALSQRWPRRGARVQ